MLPTPPRTTYTLFVGIDIAATTAPVPWTVDGSSSPRPLTIDQTAPGYAALHDQLQATGHPPEATLVVLEATGSSWITLAMTCVGFGSAVSVINPKQACDFAKALLKRAKTDPSAADTLAQLAARLQPARWIPPPAMYAELQQRRGQRNALSTLRTQVKHQLHALLQQPVVIASVHQRLADLIHQRTAQIAEVEQELAEAVCQAAAWATAAARFQMIKGSGMVTAVTILVPTSNFTLCPTAAAATAYAGLAPNPHQSGTSVRGRATIGHAGNRHLRRVLYLAPLSAARDTPMIKVFDKRVRAAGKPPKVARCAAARKLLHIAWAVAGTRWVKERDFDPAYGTQTQAAA